jgi:hypothetical protein
MWTLTLTNNYHSTVIATDNEGNHNVNPNSQYQNATPLGNAYLTIPGLGQANFIDIADNHIGGDGPETWGVLINYQGEAWVFPLRRRRRTERDAHQLRRLANK